LKRKKKKKNMLKRNLTNFLIRPRFFSKFCTKKTQKTTQHAMFSNSRRKGKAEDDTDDDINELTNFEKSPKMSKNANFRANLKGR